MSGIGKWMAGSLTAMIVSVGSLVSLAGPAQAFDAGTCDEMMPSPNYTVAEVDTVRIDTGAAGMVDFGDLPHTGVGGPGGQPRGNAVVCWQAPHETSAGVLDGVAIKGRLFADSGLRLSIATAQITYFSNANTGGSSFSWQVIGRNGASKVFSETSTNSRFINRVRIRLYSQLPGSAATLVHESNHYRG